MSEQSTTVIEFLYEIREAPDRVLLYQRNQANSHFRGLTNLGWAPITGSVEDTVRTEVERILGTRPGYETVKYTASQIQISESSIAGSFTPNKVHCPEFWE